MADFRVQVPLFQGGTVSGLASASRLTSSNVNLSRDVHSALAIVYSVSSVLSTADVGFFYATSLDGITFGSFADNAALQASTFSTANSTGVFTVNLPAIHAPFVRFVALGTGSNPVDTKVYGTLILRMS